MKKLLVCLFIIGISIGFVLTPAMASKHEPGENPDPHYPDMYVTPGGIGDLLLFSLYDVRPVQGRGAAWENYIAIENTSGKWTAFHLRFRAWKKSIEVFDHVILLSPYDVFWMTLSLASGPGKTTYPCPTCPSGFEAFEKDDVIMFSGDTHTLINSALLYENLDYTNAWGTKWDGKLRWKDKFQDSMLVFNGFNSNEGKAPKAEMWAGYIEAIGLWQLSIPKGSEDVHDLKEVVSDVHPDPAVPGSAINVNDALNALFYRYLTPSGWADTNRDSGPIPPVEPPAGQLAVWNCEDPNAPIKSCVSTYPVKTGVDSAWPDFGPILIEKRTQANFGGDDVLLVWESPGATREGEDCANVLAGNVAFGDPTNGKYQAENFIALKNFRTDLNEEWSHIYYTTGYSTGPHCDEGNYPQWRHRDGFAGGGIFFPASIGEWWYGINPDSPVYTGGAAELYFWYYVNANNTTAAGPILTDGNDLWGLNFNDVQGSVDSNNPEIGYADDGTDFHDFNRMIKNYGLPRPFPFNQQAIENEAYAFVHYFNDIWSLDDLEAALAKYQIWYTHLRTRIGVEGAAGNLDTYVVMTYPTKHDHYFFTDWPFMWHPWMGYCDNTTLTHRVAGSDVNRYWANLLTYRGDETLPGVGAGLKSLEKLIIYASDDDDIIEEEFIQGEYNKNDLTFAQWFQQKYKNGRIYVRSYIWDNEQNRPKNDPKLPEPGSPWFPDPEPPQWAPHEVNIVQAGEANDWVTPPGQIDDLNWLLARANGLFGKGHFRIDPSWLSKGQRVLWDYNDDLNDTFDDRMWHTIYQGGSYLIPAIGLVITNHDFGESQSLVTRSNMAEWHYKKDWIWLDCKPSDRFDDRYGCGE